MIAQECHPRRFEQPVHTGLGQLFSFIGQICLRYGQWLEVKEQERILLTMDDRLLKDIGLSRADAVRLTTGYSFWKYMRGVPTGPETDTTSCR